MLRRNKAGRAHDRYALSCKTYALCRARQALGTLDSVALCCVTTKEALGALQTKPGAHDRPGHTRDCACDRGIMP